jgi:hypothetical protein
VVLALRAGADVQKPPTLWRLVACRARTVHLVLEGEGVFEAFDLYFQVLQFPLLLLDE